MTPVGPVRIYSCGGATDFAISLAHPADVANFENHPAAERRIAPVGENAGKPFLRFRVVKRQNELQYVVPNAPDDRSRGEDKYYRRFTNPDDAYTMGTLLHAAFSRITRKRFSQSLTQLIRRTVATMDLKKERS